MFTAIDSQRFARTRKQEATRS